MLRDAHHVVVVGAGAAGLYATAALDAAGLDVICLEAAERTGGRLLSLDVGDGALDLGATWFWAGERRVRQAIDELGIPTFAQYTVGDAMFEDRGGIRRLQGNPIDVPSLRYAAGAQSLTDAIATTLPEGAVSLSTPVVEIAVEADGLRVDTERGVVRAEHVVLAVPPALASSRIRFRPGLSGGLAAVAAATPVWMGAVTKVVAHYPDAFWRGDGLAGAAVSARGPLWEIHDMCGAEGSPAALFGFGTTMTADPAMSEAGMTERIVAQLVRLFGPRAGSPDRVVLRDWGAAPWTSPPDVSALTDHGLFGSREFAQPAFGGRLHWASTETSAVNPGHVEGALAAAERAAAAVVAASMGA